MKFKWLPESTESTTPLGLLACTLFGWNLVQVVYLILFFIHWEEPTNSFYRALFISTVSYIYLAYIYAKKGE